MPGVEVIPSAKRLINSLRDMGYDFVQAVADIIDNSVEAGATMVAVDVQFEGDGTWVRIADNGHGMKPDMLLEAMRYGAERDYDENALGKYGLGLKTASMSQCQRLTVASRWDKDSSNICAYSWDLEHIENTNRWEVLPREQSRLEPAIFQYLNRMTGTVVLWQRLDRILGYKHPYGEAARKRLLQMCRDLELHLGMVFHRFMETKALRIIINGNEIEPWDPFCRNEKTKKLEKIRLQVEHEGVSGEVLFEPYILPHQDDFSSQDAFRRSSGPANWNQQQGFYIYRSNRMIQSGGWSSLRAPDEHTKLARIAVSFSPVLDEAFKINVAKMRVQMPPQIRDAVREAIVPIVKLAREIYDRKPTRQPSTTLPQSANPITSSPSNKPSAIVTPTPPSEEIVVMPVVNSGHQTTQAARAEMPKSPLLTQQEWSERMLAAATSEERPVVETVLQRLQ